MKLAPLITILFMQMLILLLCVYICSPLMRMGCTYEHNISRGIVFELVNGYSRVKIRVFAITATCLRGPIKIDCSSGLCISKFIEFRGFQALCIRVVKGRGLVTIIALPKALSLGLAYEHLSLCLIALFVALCVFAYLAMRKLFSTIWPLISLQLIAIVAYGVKASVNPICGINIVSVVSSPLLPTSPWISSPSLRFLASNSVIDAVSMCVVGALALQCLLVSLYVSSVEESRFVDLARLWGYSRARLYLGLELLALVPWIVAPIAALIGFSLVWHVPRILVEGFEVVYVPIAQCIALAGTCIGVSMIMSMVLRRGLAAMLSMLACLAVVIVGGLGHAVAVSAAELLNGRALEALKTVAPYTGIGVALALSPLALTAVSRLAGRESLA